MPKTPRQLSQAMLALALLTLAAAATASAQDTDGAGRAASAATVSARPEAARASDDSAKAVSHDSSGAASTDASAPAREAGARQSGQAGTQTGGAPQPTPTPSPTPLTAGKKISRAFRSAFLSPVPYATSAFNAAITQFNEDRQPHKDGGDEVADWGSRAARNFATRSTGTMFGSGFYPALFKQDPRYERLGRKGVGRRVLHAVSRVFVTRDDDGNLEPNYSRFAGSLTSSALANIWEHSTPGHDRIGTDATVRRFARSFVSGSINNIIFREFLPDILKALGR